ncbi:MAG: hypothetical protein A3E37_03780 [Candidatus Andersenbacteria bacterium RIFCSPHIGHO2_12_FULL_46_9]|nr:MAG: hypothetical protein A3B76_00990 [Candidatus Andersenbacteria bacterium RIFCSPHIGHO2_02_FULL_46_16]OGY38355.1 MAG: hypothetical protein A3E37_03780 [Candidatus Andersenbacteria bacterium RIFCSPHIGHO2_12_FULL_46_9]OGY38424.1 MAG: hypothetical protein A3I08_02635 [Candidatus Andersenbacteria bacterium RIFCSPLOWO2_02_FULL_46_11]OGY41958.1 MAG: hypothetical protein A3G57_04585 [Candidatus Andersenbacteria bacterium RIFCSPLOWO2_12_FULL_45_8]HBE90550.1 hypothetical protein [Candidatus Anderse
MVQFKREWTKQFAGTDWNCHWIIKYEDGLISFDYSAVLSAEEYSSLWVRRKFEIPETELADAINDVVEKRTAFLDDSAYKKKFVLEESEGEVTITFFCRIYQDGSGRDFKEDIPNAFLKMMGMR